ncbi:nuclear transport factor 2 family protein [Marinicaulis aureus]|uniref:Nuclear transport factor 2 family protein n=1 Tax=Hyphococcus aureus TaxID=2666033 RepID=A0ABW1L0A5_9PROT
MTPETRRAIEADCTRLIHHYANLTDAHDWAAIVALYAEGGLMTRPTAPDAPIIGREALMEAFTARPPRISRHVCANVVVDVTSEIEASAFSVILLFTGAEAEDGGLPIKGEGAPLVGTYRDKFRKTAEGWRFAERRGALSFRP